MKNQFTTTWIGRIKQVPRAFTVSLAFALSLPGAAVAQNTAKGSPLTLQQAVAIALEKNPERKAAAAETKVAAADIQSARSVLLPRITFSETALRGNDPVYVFGSKLRQQRFATPDFALNTLNTPTPFGNFATRFSGSWTLFDSLASWRSINRAELAKDAAEHQLERAEQEIEYRVVESYFAALLAKKQVAVADTSWKAAEAIAEKSKNRYETGIAVQSDYLSAQVRASTRKQQLIQAENNLALARAQLVLALGLSSQSDFEPNDDLSERSLPVSKLEDLEKSAMESRPDLRRIQSGEQAQRESVSIAKSSFGPRINAIASWEADRSSFLGNNGGNNWVAGIELQFDLFQGGAKRAQLARERANLEKVSALREAAKDAVRLEVRRAFYDMDAAKRQLEVARLAISDSNESLRVNQNRYEAGLSTITDLLASEEMAQRSQTDYWQTLCRYYTSYTALELAAGTLNPHSPVVTP